MLFLLFCSCLLLLISIHLSSMKVNVTCAFLYIRIYLYIVAFFPRGKFGRKLFRKRKSTRFLTLVPLFLFAFFFVILPDAVAWSARHHHLQPKTHGKKNTPTFSIYLDICTCPIWFWSHGWWLDTMPASWNRISCWRCSTSNYSILFISRYFCCLLLFIFTHVS